MKKITIIFVVFVMILPAALFAASEPIKDLSLGNKWYYNVIWSIKGTGGECFDIIETVVGDTLIDSMTFKKIESRMTRAYNPENGAFSPVNSVSYFYEKADSNSVETAYTWNKMFVKYPFYNFEWNTGDYNKFEASYSPIQIWVKDKGYTTFAGQQYQYIKILAYEYRLYPNDNTYTIIDKIGVLCLNSEHVNDNYYSKTLTGAVIDGVMYGDTTSTLAVKEEQPHIPACMVILGNYPNPFNMATSIEFTLPVKSGIVLTIYNSLGQEVKRFVEEYAEPGTKTLLWDGCDEYGNPMTSGIYIYNLQLDNGQIISNKMLLLK